MLTESDSVRTTILANRLNSITREMGISLIRTTSSSFFQAKDMCTGILDAKGAILAQAEYLPLMAYSLAPMVESIHEMFGDDIHPGDVFIHNDVFRGCNQLQDLGFFRPIFWNGELILWTATKGHILDLGGPVFGGYNPAAREVWEETLRIPPMKIWDRGEIRYDVWEMLLANNRVPDFTARDFKAMIGGCIVGEERLNEEIAERGWPQFQNDVHALLNMTERWMRAEISAIPDGTYTGEARVYHDGLNPRAELLAQLAVTVAGDRIHFDFTGTDSQGKGWINGVYSTTYAALIGVLFMCVDPLMPHNAGATRPIQVTLPAGTFLNANYPAATVRGNLTCNDVVSECMIQCFTQAVPDRMFAAWHRPLIAGMFGRDPRTNRLYYDVTFLSFGGTGAAKNADGWGHQGLITATGMRIQDYELQESQSPHLILKHEYRLDGGGPGRWRGGTGVHVRYQTYANPAYSVTRGTSDYSPFGILGGSSGAAASLRFEKPDGTVISAESNAYYELTPGTIVDILSCGGGGYGSPRERPVAVVVEDVRAELVSLEAAREIYRVAVDPTTGDVLDAATTSLRSS